MKSAHRHELQTNSLAQQLDSGIEKLRPYTSTIVVVFVAVAVLFLIWSYVSKSATVRQEEAWSAYNEAISTLPPSLERLDRASVEHPNTAMQQLADVTWADGQVYIASQNYIYNRASATDALKKATSRYLNVLQTTDDERLVNRAHLGLARVYEMQGQLDKAIEEYSKIKGGYKEYAEIQVERLKEPEAAETYAWLAKAQPPRMTPPAGPGTPGEKPEFSTGDISLPAGTETDVPMATEPATSFDDLLKGLGELPTSEGGKADAFGRPSTTPNATPAEPAPPATEEAPPAEEESKSPPAEGEEAPATETAPATEAAPADEQTEAAPADEKAVP